MDTGAVGQTGRSVMLSVMTVKEHDLGTATTRSQNMAENIVLETQSWRTSVRLRDVLSVRFYCCFTSYLLDAQPKAAKALNVTLL